MLKERPDKEISRKELGAFVMQELKKLDKVAYVRFASVYRDFRDIDDFVTGGAGPSRHEGVTAARPVPSHPIVDSSAPGRHRAGSGAPAVPRQPAADPGGHRHARWRCWPGMLVVEDRTSRLAPDFLAEVVLYALSATNLTMLLALVFLLARNVIKSIVEGRRGRCRSRGSAPSWCSRCSG